MPGSVFSGQIGTVSMARGEICGSLGACELFARCSWSGLLSSDGSLMLGSSVLREGEESSVPSKTELSGDVRAVAVLTIDVAGVLEDTSTNARVC